MAETVPSEEKLSRKSELIRGPRRDPLTNFFVISSVEVDITSKDSLAQAIQTIETQTPKGIQVL